MKRIHVAQPWLSLRTSPTPDRWPRNSQALEETAFAIFPAGSSRLPSLDVTKTLPSLVAVLLSPNPHKWEGG